MGTFGSKILPKWFCFCGPRTAGSTFELRNDPRNTGSGDSIQSDRFDETTQVIIHDMITNKTSVALKLDVENDPDPLRYIACPLPERSNEVPVELPLDGASLPYQICMLDFAKLGLNTKRQQGKIPYIYLTNVQPPPATQSNVAANVLGGSAVGAAHASTKSSSSPAQRHPCRPKISSSSASGPISSTPGTAVQLPTCPSLSLVPSISTAPGAAAHPPIQAKISPLPPQPKILRTEVQLPTVPNISPSPSQLQESLQHIPKPSISHPQPQSSSSPSSSRTAGVSKPTASQQAPASASTSPSLPIPPTPNG